MTPDRKKKKLQENKKVSTNKLELIKSITMRRKILEMKRGSTTGMKKTSREPSIPLTHGDPTQH
jgi:hypothetical protein